MDYSPAPQIQQPNLLQAYVQGRMAPGMLQEQQNQLQGQQQQLQTGQLNIDQLRLAMQKQQMLMSLAGRLAGQPTPDGPSPGTQAYGAQAASGQPTGGIQNGPQAEVSQPSPLGPEIDPRTRAAVGMLSPDALKGLGEAQDQSLKDAQLRAQMPGSPLSALQAFAANPNAGSALLQNPNMIRQWTGLAAQFGFDPKDMSDINVRRVATLAANQQLAALKLPLLPMPQHFTQKRGPDGSIIQTDDITGKQDTVVGREPIGLLASNAPLIPGSDPEIQSYVQNIKDGKATLANVPMNKRGSVSVALNQLPPGEYPPNVQRKFTLSAEAITKQFTNMSAYKLTADGKPYLARIEAAMAHPGSVSDADLLDSMVKLNTGGNAVTEAQVSLITHGKSFSDSMETFKNKLKNGGVLSPDQREQIHGIAQDIYSNYLKQYQPIYEQAAQQLTAAGIPKAFWTIPDLNGINAASTNPGAPASGAWGKASVVK